jgi:hypothetical protein
MKETAMQPIRRSIVVLGLGLAALLLMSGSPVASGAATSDGADPPSTNVLILTNASSGSSTIATKGETVIVKLAGHHLRWSEAQVAPTTSAAAVLVRVSGHTATNGSSTTTFKVARYGSAQLQATGVPKCGAEDGCSAFVLLWQASVVVPVVDPPPPTATAFAPTA